ncbi:hypothetical protein MP228_007302 [Amoeboaphelidium protococcarum]|nr:hypothetical protein MP228_007302 [Amoeboaphelidium protococcarum]
MQMLKEDIRTIPNMLTMSRLLLSPAIGYWIYAQDYKFALGAFAFASVTDLVDGYIARNFNQRTYLGTVLDPLADKVLMTTVTLSLATTSLLPTYLAALIVGRDVLLSAAVMVYRYMSLSKPRTFKKYIDPTIPSVEIKPTQISKYNTFLQLVLMGSSLSAPVLFGVESHWLLSTMQYTVAASTVLSGASYVFAKDAVKILKQKTTSAGAKSPENKAASASSKNTSSKVNADQKK